MDLRERTVQLARVEVGGIHTVHVQAAGRFEAEADEALVLPFEVVHQDREMVIPLLARGVHVAVDRRRVVVLLDELDHRVAEVAERVRHIGLLVGPAIREGVTPVMG